LAFSAGGDVFGGQCVASQILPCLRKTICGDYTESKFCSDACFKSARKDTKKAWWNEHGPEWRKSRKKKKK
jgi:hypothetical protein